MDKPVISSEVNAASFDATRDDIFNRIASRYDLLSDLFSLCIHRLWKRRMAHRIFALPWERMLDVAAGTGDIALRVAKKLGTEKQRSCIVSDICPAMLAIPIFSTIFFWKLVTSSKPGTFVFEIQLLISIRICPFCPPLPPSTSMVMNHSLVFIPFTVAVFPVAFPSTVTLESFAPTLAIIFSICALVCANVITE